MRTNEIIVEMYQNSNCEVEKELLLNELVEQNEKLCYSIANKYRNKYLSLEDCQQICRIKLYQSADSYDASKGYKFTTFAYASITRFLYNQIRYSMPKGYRKSTTTLPEHLKDTFSLEFMRSDSEQEEYNLSSKYLSVDENYDDKVTVDYIRNEAWEYCKETMRGTKLLVAKEVIFNESFDIHEVSDKLGANFKSINTTRGRVRKELREVFQGI